MSFPNCYYTIRPVDAPEGYDLSMGPSAIPPYPPAAPASVKTLRKRWQIIGDNDSFNIISGDGKYKPPHQYKWVKYLSVLYIPLFSDPADEFKIESAGNGLWVIGVPNEDLLLTFNGVNAYPQLTFQPARAGSSAQLFEIIRGD